MINEDNLNKMYEGLIENHEMTTKELNSYGFNSKDLSDLIEQGILTRVKRGYYSFLSVEKLYNYGKKLISNKEYDKSTLCFKKCYELDSNNKSVCFQLFFRSILSQDYDKALEYFEKLDESDNEYYITDNYLYIYLLSMIIELPEKYKSYAKYIKFEDLKAKEDDSRFTDIVMENKIRKAIHTKKFSVAYILLKEVLTQKGKLNIQNILVRTLIRQIKDVKNNSTNTILSMINNDEYQNIIDYLSTKEEQIYLDISDKLIKNLSHNLLYIKRTNEIPKINITNTDKVHEAIYGNNFSLAISLIEQKNNENSLTNGKNPIYLLLIKINEQINKIKSEKYIEIEEDITENQIEELTEKEEFIENQNEKETIELEQQPIIQNTNITFIDITNYLMQQDLDNAFIAIRSYLENINKKQYEFLIVDLIKLSVIENDIAFTKPMVVLTYISRENYEFNISEYIQDFYVALSQNKFEQARIYLDILSKSSNLGIECVLTDSLEQVLNNTEKMLSNKKSDKVVTSEVVQPTLEREKNIVSKESTEEEKVELKKEENIKTKKEVKVNVKENEINVAELIDSKLDELINNGIVILKPMDSETRRKIHKYVENIRYIASFSIGSDDERQVVLRHRPYIEKFEHSEVKSLGDQAYRDKDYDTCIEQYKKLLIAYTNPKSYVFSKIGFAYMMKKIKN